MSKLRLSFTTVKAVFRHRIAWLCTIILLAGLSITLAAKYRSFEKTALANTDAKAQQGCCSTVPATLRRMIGTYYNTEDGFQSSLVLNNKGPNVIAVTPILHSKNGQTFNAPQVFVNGESSLEVDLNAMANSAGANFKSGSFEFTYQGRMMEMGGGLRIVNTAKSLIFDEQLLEPGMKFSSPKLEAVYAIPSDKADASVIVTNTTAQPLSLNGSATFVGANGQHPINGTLGAYETSVVNLPNGLVKQSTAGAVSITHNGASGAVMAIVHIWDKDKGFSTAVNFADPAQGKTTQLHGAGLRLGVVNNATLKPVIVVRNVGTAATTVNARVPYTKDDGSTATITLPQTSLAAGETKLLNTTHPGLGQTNIAAAGLEIEYTGAPGSVLASAYSVSPDGNQVFTVPMKDPQGGLSSTGGYPWFINGTASTVVYIKNTTTTPQRFHLDIVYQDQGVMDRWGSNTRLLAPGQTIAFDVRKIRDTQEAGSAGNKIPLTATSGHVAWSYLDNADKMFTGRAQTVDTANGLVSTYECQCNCGYSYNASQLLPSSISGFIGDYTNLSAQEKDWLCYSTYSSWYDINYKSTFSSQYTIVATCNGPVATAVGLGTTNLYASFAATQKIWNGFGCASIPLTPTASTTCTVNPHNISGSNTLWYFNGESPSNYSTSVTLSVPAVYNSYTWSITNGSDKIEFVGPTNSYSVTVRSKYRSETQLDCAVRVNLSGTNSNPFSLTVRAPQMLESVSTSHNTDPVYQYRSTLVYRIRDQFTAVLPSGVPVNESWTSSVAYDYTGSNWRRADPKGLNSPNAEFGDAIGGEAIGYTPTATGPQNPLSSTMVTNWGQAWKVGSSSIGVGRPVQYDVIQKYLDHAIHTGISTPTQ